ncbi:MAG: KpsF/GutQ family sugar-phosphate isomerase [Alphaproteobacteria bacterium]
MSTSARAETDASNDLTDQAARDIEAGRGVIDAAVTGLHALSDTLGDDFAKAVETLSRIARDGSSGRVIVSGMGKSGHIGRKIAATLASTGTPAQFVHPGEASHGDLGMITEYDAVIAISNSGETHELTDLIQFVKRFGIPLVGITSRAGSALDLAADVALRLPNLPEAGTIGLAPTTSTTMTLALGDALCVALLERRGFTAGDFKVFHPGGKLGRQLLRVGDLMHTGSEIPMVQVGKPMSEALLEMTSKHFGCTAVVDADGRICGVVTDGDLRRHMGDDIMNQPVEDVMTRDPVCFQNTDMAAEALSVMNERQITVAFILTNDKFPWGIIHLHDFLRAGVA